MHEPLFTIIIHYEPLLTVIVHYEPLLTIIIHYEPLLSMINHWTTVAKKQHSNQQEKTWDLLSCCTMQHMPAGTIDSPGGGWTVKP